MENPWLGIDLLDYENHMGASNVLQAPMLAALMGDLVSAYTPHSLCILGVAGGNGLADLSRSSVKKVIAIDINPHYLEVCRRRYAMSFEHFVAVQHDLSSELPPVGTSDLVYAALIVEYIDQSRFAAYMCDLVAPRGVLVFVFQNRGVEITPISQTGISSLSRLTSVHTYVHIEEILEHLERRHFQILDRRVLEPAAGKSFTVLVTRAPECESH
jgi:hypothetical protein